MGLVNANSAVVRRMTYDLPEIMDAIEEVYCRVVQDTTQFMTVRCNKVSIFSEFILLICFHFTLYPHFLLPLF